MKRNLPCEYMEIEQAPKRQREEATTYVTFAVCYDHRKNPSMNKHRKSSLMEVAEGNGINFSQALPQVTAGDFPPALMAIAGESFRENLEIAKMSMKPRSPTK